MTTLNLSADYIMSEDIIERLNELEERFEAYLEDGGEPDGFRDFEELEELRDISEDGENTFGDWNHGVTLIEECCLPEHAREVASGLIHSGSSSFAEWPFNHIDWNEAAEDLKMDYGSIDIHGVTYWGHA